MTLSTLQKRIKRTKLSWIFFLIIFTFGFENANAQTGLNFQGVARNSNNVILASQQISLRLSILQGTATGTAEYTETRTVTTNAQGLFTAVIGEAGATSTLGNFTTINWKNTPKYLKIEMDAAAGSNFITMGTTQFQYVAYAQFANGVDAENIAGIVPVARGGTGTSSLAALKTALAIDKTTVGLANVDNTTDLLKPISTATQTALNLKANTDTSTFTKDITVNGISIGRGPASKLSNTRIGIAALSNNTIGIDNTAMGMSALSENTTGVGNTANGVNALKQNTIGFYNTAFGIDALNSNTIGGNNTATGSSTLFNNTTGVNNTAIGAQALSNNTSGSHNTAIGLFALTANTTGIGNIAAGNQALEKNTDGVYNTALGRMALRNNITGSALTAIGNEADVSADGLVNATVIGNGAIVTTSNSIQLGNREVTAVNTSGLITAAGFGTATGTSSQFLKANGTVDGNSYVNSTATKIKIGEAAGGINQGLNSIGIGLYAGSTNQGDLSVAIGSQSGYINQGANAIAMGITSGSFSQANSAVAIGNNAGNELQGASAIAIGKNAGKSSQGLNSIAIGTSAGYTNQAASSIILNASGSNLDAATNGFFVAPVRSATQSNNLFYNATTKEITYGTAAVTAVDAGTLTGTTLNATITGSSLTSVGTIASGIWSGTAVAIANGGTGQTSIGGIKTTLGLSGLEVAIGSLAGLTSQGSNAVAIGAQAGFSSQGSNAVAIGYNASRYIQGSNAVAIGANSDAGYDNSVAIGNQASTSASNTIQLGNSSVTDVKTFGTLTAGAVTYPKTHGTTGQVLTTTGSGTLTWTGTHYIGESYGGGIVFYVYDDGKHGLIAATVDQSNNMQWYNGAYTVTNVLKTGINGGISNTDRIIINQGAGSYAAQICANYAGGNYADWYLPSKYELNLLYLQKLVVGGFANDLYWSSTEYDNAMVQMQSFSSSSVGVAQKNNTYHVRAIRAF